jgi:tetratricopeptide (TPR) repeat protein
MRSEFYGHGWLIALAFAAAVAASGPATADDRQECLNGSKETAAATIDACSRAIESRDYDDGELSSLYHHRGFAWSWTGIADRVDRALKDYNEAIRLEPKAVGSLLNRAQIYNQRRDYDQAIADVNQAFDGDLSDYGKRVGYGQRGYAYQSKGDNDRAIADYSNSIQLDPDNWVTVTARGNAYLVKGDLDHAIADYDHVIALYPKYSVPYYNRCLAYKEKGDLDRVVADCSQAIALYPQYRDAYYYRAYAYRAKGDVDRAIADYDQMIALNPNDQDTYCNRASAHFSRGDYRRALADFAHGLSLSWLAVIMFLGAAAWLCGRTMRPLRGRESGQTMIEICERELAELQHRNAALEKIAMALERRSSG